MQLVHLQVIKKNGEGFRRGRILKHFLMDVDFKNPVRVRIRVRVRVRIRVRVRVGVRVGARVKVRVRQGQG
jgi:hypothetical protein